MGEGTEAYFARSAAQPLPFSSARVAHSSGRSLYGARGGPHRTYPEALNRAFSAWTLYSAKWLASPGGITEGTDCMSFQMASTFAASSARIASIKATTGSGPMTAEVDQ